MNIPVEVARAQGHHGIKGAVHGSKGGRPRLDLTEAERIERRKAQKLAARPAKLTDLERAERKAAKEREWAAIMAKRFPNGRGPRPGSVARRTVPAVTHSPRVAPSPLAAVVGRNEPCPCGSGRKFKKCCSP